VLYALSQNHRRDPAIEPVRIQQTTRRQSTALPSRARGIRI
jgi:hypothetical protein